MTIAVAVLKPNERVVQDAAPVAAIYRDMGTQAAEKVVGRAIDALALSMAGLADQVRRHDLDEMGRALRRLQRMADRLGMVSLSLVAGDLRLCLDGGDATAFSAVWARLVRVAERSLAPGSGCLGLSV